MAITEKVKKLTEELEELEKLRSDEEVSKALNILDNIEEETKVTEGYISLTIWKEEVLQHINSGIEETKDLLKTCKYGGNNSLQQILHEFYEIADHFK